MTGLTSHIIHNNPATLTISLEDEAAAYIAQKNITDINDFINQLLKDEKDRQKK